MPLCSVRVYKIFYDKAKYRWRGPKLRHILQVIAPLQPLKMNADDMYVLKKSELASCLWFDFFNDAYMFLFTLSFFSHNVPHLTLHVQCEVKACGMSDLFDLALPEYASEHKDHYEEHMPNSLIWDPWTSWYFSFLKNIIYFVVVHMFPHDNLRTFHKIQGQSVGDN